MRRLLAAGLLGLAIIAATGTETTVAAWQDRISVTNDATSARFLLRLTEADGTTQAVAPWRVEGLLPGDTTDDLVILARSDEESFGYGQGGPPSGRLSIRLVGSLELDHGTSALAEQILLELTAAPVQHDGTCPDDLDPVAAVTVRDFLDAGPVTIDDLRPGEARCIRLRGRLADDAPAAVGEHRLTFGTTVTLTQLAPNGTVTP